jgi:hypothetical protein
MYERLQVHARMEATPPSLGFRETNLFWENV